MLSKNEAIFVLKSGLIGFVAGVLFGVFKDLYTGLKKR